VTEDRIPAWIRIPTDVDATIERCPDGRATDRIFSVGDRVVVKPGNRYDTNRPLPPSILPFAGHYGHVIRASDSFSHLCEVSLEGHVEGPDKAIPYAVNGPERGPFPREGRSGWMFLFTEIEHAD
jgi:hypothetical protein